MARKLETDDSVAELLSLALKLQDFFPEFLGEHARKLFPRSELGLYPAGSRLLTQGEEGRDLFVIQTGRVAVTKGPAGQEVAMRELGPGDLLGEIALMGKGVRTASATVVAEARIFRLDHRDTDYIVRHNPELSSHLLKLVAERLA